MNRHGVLINGTNDTVTLEVYERSEDSPTGPIVAKVPLSRKGVEMTVAHLNDWLEGRSGWEPDSNAQRLQENWNAP